MNYLFINITKSSLYYIVIWYYQLLNSNKIQNLRKIYAEFSLLEEMKNYLNNILYVESFKNAKKVLFYSTKDSFIETVKLNQLQKYIKYSDLKNILGKHSFEYQYKTLGYELDNARILCKKMKEQELDNIYQINMKNLIVHDEIESLQEFLNSRIPIYLRKKRILYFYITERYSKIFLISNGEIINYCVLNNTNLNSFYRFFSMKDDVLKVFQSSFQYFVNFCKEYTRKNVIFAPYDSFFKDLFYKLSLFTSNKQEANK